MPESNITQLAARFADGLKPVQLIHDIKSSAVLKDKNTKQTITQLVDYLVWYGESREAYKVVAAFEQLINQLPAEEKVRMREEYHAVISRLHFLTLQYRSDDEVLKIIEFGLAAALHDPELLVVEYLRQKLLDFFVLKKRDEYKLRLNQAINKNNEQLTTAKVPLRDGEQRGTTQNWLKHYISSVGVGVASNLAKAEYFLLLNTLPNLTNQEKRVVKDFIEIVEFIKKSSLSLEGLEESVIFIDKDGKRKMFSQGIIEDFSSQRYFQISNKERKLLEPIVSNAPPAIVSTSEQEILLAYQGDKKQKKEIAKVEGKLAKKLRDDIVKLRAEFFKAVQAKDIVKTVAILRILAQKQDLEPILQQDEKLFKFLAVTWERQYGKDLAAEFKKAPAQFKFVRLFLRYVLEQRLGLGRNDAARFGMQVGNILVSLGKPEYKQVAYFDVKTKIFNWFEE